MYTFRVIQIYQLAATRQISHRTARDLVMKLAEEIEQKLHAQQRAQSDLDRNNWDL